MRTAMVGLVAVFCQPKLHGYQSLLITDLVNHTSQSDGSLLLSGAQNTTKEECISRDCCFNSHYSATTQNGPQCFYAANAEISAYFQNSLSTQGMRLSSDIDMYTPLCLAVLPII